MSDWPNIAIDSYQFSKVMRKRNIKNEIQIRFSKWWENEKQKPKFKSPFQSAAKTKNEKRNSNPFSNVTSRQKTKNRNVNGIPFYKAEENRKITMKCECHYAIEKRLALRYTHCFARLQLQRETSRNFLVARMRFCSLFVFCFFTAAHFHLGGRRHFSFSHRC